jgi:hypothetical protein
MRFGRMRKDSWVRNLPNKRRERDREMFSWICTASYEH